MEKYKNLIDAIENGNSGQAVEELKAFLKTDDGKAERFTHWRKTRSEEEWELFTRMMAFEEDYFEDMTLSKDSDISAFTDEETGEMVDNPTDYSQYLSLNKYRIYVVPYDGSIGGCYFPLEKKFEIADKYVEDETILLHEMIHAYEELLTAQENNYYVCIKLYEKLRTQVPELMSMIATHSHDFIREESHSPFFLLKSFDLDIRLGKPFGTVCGYKREEYFNSEETQD